MRQAGWPEEGCKNPQENWGLILAKKVACPRDLTGKERSLCQSGVGESCTKTGEARGDWLSTCKDFKLCSVVILSNTCELIHLKNGYGRYFWKKRRFDNCSWSSFRKRVGMGRRYLDYHEKMDHLSRNCDCYDPVIVTVLYIKISFSPFSKTQTKHNSNYLTKFLMGPSGSWISILLCEFFLNSSVNKGL